MSSASKTVVKTLSVRVKDRHAKVLSRMAKCVMDARLGYALPNQLRNKAIAHGVVFEEIDEVTTTHQPCLYCAVVSDSSPKGRWSGLGIREWTCMACGMRHDRDINAARNTFSRSGMSVSQEKSPALDGGGCQLLVTID